MRPEPGSPAGAGELLGCAITGGAAALRDGRAAGVAALGLADRLALWPGENETLRLGERLAIALLALLPHPAARLPAARMAAKEKAPSKAPHA
jgi:hypothetical protein